MNPSVIALPVDRPFLLSLAHRWLDHARQHRRDPADGILILPTRRAARAAAAAFLQAHGKPLVLPRIIAIGSLDETGLVLTNALELPTAIKTHARRIVLARLILAARVDDRPFPCLAEALLLADELALLIDEAEQAEIDLAANLQQIVAPEIATHWQRTLDFLEIVTHAWPKILAERGLVDGSKRHRMLLDAEAARLATLRPRYPIWLAGFSAASPALTRLARTIAALEHGAVVLAGYDPELAESAWNTLIDTPSHPQAGLKRFLAAIGASRDDVAHRANSMGAVPEGRVQLLRRAFLPAGFLSAWQEGLPFRPVNLFRLACADEQEEARAIALLLRDALESPEETAALVTPDRSLATRVSAEMSRLGIRTEDSAGEPLANSPPATFLRLVAHAATEKYSAIPLLSLLKHPLAAVGRTPSECRSMARTLDLFLREHQPQPGFASLKAIAEHAGNGALADFIADLDDRTRALGNIMSASAVPPLALLEALICAGELLASSDSDASPEPLWSGEAGGELSRHLAEILDSFDESLPEVSPGELPMLLETLLAGAILRRPRTRDAEPRVAIWGIMEARLQYVDTLVLGSMVEGVFPAEPDPGPFLSREMRRDAGLPDAMDRIGEMAQDVINLVASCPRVVLSAPKKRARSPTIVSRFLLRIETMLNGAGETLTPHPAEAWAAQLDHEKERVLRPPPEPRPPRMRRPLRYSISDVATLLADPYTIYARRILHLVPLEPLDAETDAALFGNIVHQGLAEMASDPRALAAPDAAGKLANVFERLLQDSHVRSALNVFWKVRLRRIADWIVGLERERPPFTVVGRERTGEWRFRQFTIHGRADRIERRNDGSIAIIDYKTGWAPDDQAVGTGISPQLPLEAVIAEAGGFGADFHGPVVELAYWKLTGGATEGQIRTLFNEDPEALAMAITQARTKIPAILAYYAHPEVPFLDMPHPGRQPYAQPYAGVSRRAEWDDTV